ncbi:MAG: DUF3040 domain-containing protein [Actinobacteria bacterium]|nr:DUF3040 domain-containing protein [Actinomycetota bacterium]
MPLSEDEQRILQEIERNFYDSDPAFAREVSTKTLYRHAGRNLKWAGVGFALGLVVLILGFTQSVLLGFLGFLIMVGCAFLFYLNAAKMGRAGLQSVSQRTGNISEMFGRRSQNLRERFRRNED